MKVFITDELRVRKTAIEFARNLLSNVSKENDSASDSSGKSKPKNEIDVAQYLVEGKKVKLLFRVTWCQVTWFCSLDTF